MMHISKTGFTLIEVMVAAAILAVGCLGVLGLILTSIRYNNDSHMRTQATYVAEQEVALLHAIGDTSVCESSTWLELTNLTYGSEAIPYQPRNMDPSFRIYCREYETDATKDPIAIRVTWGSSGGTCALADADLPKLDTFKDQKGLGCDFITLPYVPIKDSTLSIGGGT